MARAKKPTNRPKAYSYLRFSTPEQSKGDSHRRQASAAQDYADRHGLDLDEKLTFRDLGVSAFRGANVVEGALGQFISAVDSGRVRRGSYLLVENLDRLSRDKIMPALNRFSSLLEKGVSIVTLSDGKVYTAESLNNIQDLMLSLLVMSRAHDESEMKSRRIKASWQSKRERAAANGHILTARAPAWLRLKDGKFEVIKERAAIIRRIFDMTLAGHGKASIAYRLNRDGVETFGDGPTEARKAKGWHPSYIQKILRNEAVIGRYQPMRRVFVEGKKKREPEGAPIEGYFPSILKDSAIFYRVKRSPGLVSGHKGSALTNVLSGLVRCALCGGPMHYVNKGPGSKGGQYFACDNARRNGTCNAKSVRFDVVTVAILNSLEDVEIDLRAFIGSAPADRRQELGHSIDAIDGQIAEAEASITNLLDALERRPSLAIEKRLGDQEAALAKLRENKERLQGEMHDTATVDQAGDVIEAMREFNRSGDQAALRARLHAALKGIVEHVYVCLGDDSRKVFEDGVLWADKLTGGKALPSILHRKGFEAIMERAKVSTEVKFKAPNRSLFLYADPRRAGTFLAGAVRKNEGGSIAEYKLKVFMLGGLR